MTDSPMRSRDKAIQSLYEIEINNDIYVNKEIESKPGHGRFCKGLINGVINNLEELDHKLIKYLDRPIKALDIIEKNVLRLATYELIYKRELDNPIIINEAIRLAKKYGSVDGYKYINAILDKMIKAEDLKSYNRQK